MEIHNCNGNDDADLDNGTDDDDDYYYYHYYYYYCTSLLRGKQKGNGTK